MVILIYIAFYLFALYAESLQTRNKRYWLMAICILLAFLAGTRDYSWADTGVYVTSFLDYTPTFANLTQYSQPYGYEEIGFFYIKHLINIVFILSLAYVPIFPVSIWQETSSKSEQDFRMRLF